MPGQENASHRAPALQLLGCWAIDYVDRLAPFAQTNVSQGHRCCCRLRDALKYCGCHFSFRQTSLLPSKITVF